MHVPGRMTVLATILAAWSCGSATSPDRGPSASVATIAVEPSSSTLDVGADVPLHAVVQDGSGQPVTGVTVVWTVQDSTVARVSSLGVVSALGAGSTKVAASASGVSAVATVIVRRTPVASVAVQPGAPALLQGQTVALTATPLDAGGAPLPDRVVAWSSSNGDVASVTPDGVVHAGAVGSATITATSEGVSGSATVTVAPVPVGSVSLLPTTATLVAGTSTTLTATVRDANGAVVTDRIVTWTSSDARVAIVSTAGVVTGVAPGSAAISAASEGRSDTTAITVVSPAIASVAVQPSPATVRLGASVTLTATVKDVTGAVVTDRPVAWASSNTAVASVTASGVVTGRAIGSATISATSGGKSGSAMVNVVAVPVGSVTVAPSALSLVPTQSKALAATVRDANGAVVGDRVVDWTSSNTAVATVSASGVVTGVAPGTAIVTATSEGKSGSANVTVTRVPVGSVVVSPPSANVTAGQTVALTATVRDTAGVVVTDRAVSWKSSDTDVASVSGAGVVTTLSAGTATITATSETKSGSAVITVRPVPVASVTLDPTDATITPDQTVTFTATTKSADGTVLTGRVVTFASDNVNAARVASDGTVTGVAPGSATITASSEGKSATATVTVRAAVAYVVVSPSVVVVKRNGTVQLSAAAYDASNNRLFGRSVTWDSSDEHLATVSPTGVVTAKKAGVVTITATVEGKSDSARVTVTN